MSARRIRRLPPGEEHLAWLRGRMPSEALQEDYARDVEGSPLGRWVAARDNRAMKRGPRKRRQNRA